MRTTMAIDDELLGQAKKRAAEQGRTLGSYVEESLRTALTVRPVAAQRVILPSFGSDGPHPGVDLTSNRELYDLLDTDGQRT